MDSLGLLGAYKGEKYSPQLTQYNKCEKFTLRISSELTQIRLMILSLYHEFLIRSL